MKAGLLDRAERLFAELIESDAHTPSALHSLLEHPGFGNGPYSVGAELELYLVNRYGRPLGAAGVRYKLAEYVRAAAKELPSLRKKRVSPHTYRHYLPFLTMSCRATPTYFLRQIREPKAT